MGETKAKEELIREFSAGGVVFKKEGSQTFWLVAGSNPSKLYPKEVWRLPKGWLDDRSGGKLPGPLAQGKKKAKEEEIQKAATREVEEEGGVKTKIILKIGTERFFFTSKEGKRILKFVTFYLMEWMKDSPSGFSFETSEIAWLVFDEAYKRLSYSSEKKVLKKARQILEMPIQENLL